ncbi:flagellar biosynthetic protein FliR [Schlesneria paludicola]|uniref:flagellar biosynthetic protein FliR n=1 Tax=Schlesneria paludicola TaxID=360056 RepID=UPI00029B1515|nr:flagellar biosynthetic protein FliR [Schlesneria paludicola]
MNELITQLLADPWGRLLLQYAALGGAEQALMFVLVASRLAGAFIVAPQLMPSSIPWTVRLGIVVILALLIAPLLVTSWTVIAEVELTAFSASMEGSLATATGMLCLIASEVGLGTLFGIGILTIMAGLRLAGELLDRHSGLGMGAIYNPEWSSGESAGGTLIQLLGIATFLLIEPIGGGEQILGCLIQSFRTIPAGCSWGSLSAIELLGGVVQFSLQFAIRVALPVIATMILVDLTLAFANRGVSSPANSSQLAIRACAGLAVLTVSTRAIPDLVSDATLVTVRLVSGIH